MRLFISYARIDKSTCVQIAEMLDIHDVWYDQRIYAGQDWWEEILRRLDWCDVFIYLLSSYSIASQYCRDEYQIARRLKKRIFPVLIDDNCDVPEAIRKFQYADLSRGLTGESVSMLLNSLYRIEQQIKTQTPVEKPVLTDLSPEEKESSIPMPTEPTNLIVQAAQAIDEGKFDNAHFLLKQAKEREEDFEFVDIDALIADVERSLNHQADKVKMEREYRTIAELIRRRKTRRVGCMSFQTFHSVYPDYDPHNLARYCNNNYRNGRMPSAPQSMSAREITPAISNGSHDNAREHIPVKPVQSQTASAPVSSSPSPSPSTQADDSALATLSWCDIPSGPVDGVRVGAFQIAQYPVSNRQFHVFLRDPRGYRNSHWWQFSRHAKLWFRNHPRPRPPYARDENHPRENVSWYEAMAYCNWLSYRLKRKVTLPNRLRWKRALRGDSGQEFPWGETFNPALCNTRNSGIRKTTPVDAYPDGASPFGVMDMIGNVWEWCVNTRPDEPDTIRDRSYRAAMGGSFNTTYHPRRHNFEMYIDPEYYGNTIGFRPVILP